MHYDTYLRPFFTTRAIKIACTLGTLQNYNRPMVVKLMNVKYNAVK